MKTEKAPVINQREFVVVFNRAVKSRPGWIHLVPKGELPNREAGLVQVLDDQSLDSIMNRINAEKTRMGADWPGIYAGREHFIYNADKDSEALAWYKTFERNADGIWGKDEDLTDLGQTAVKNKHYKYTSFVADRSDLQKIDGNRYRVMAIDTVGFTNMANGKELLAPISNRQAAGGHTFADADASVDNNKNQNKGNKMKEVLTELGLSADASEQSAQAAVIKLKNRIAALEPLEGEITKLKNRVSDLDTQNVDGLFSARGIKDEKVLNRLKPVLAKMETVADRTAFLDDCGFKAPEAGKKNETDAQKKLYNRDGKSPNGEKTGTENNESGEATKEEKTQATKVMNRAREIVKETKNTSLATAISMAQRELTAAAQ